MTHEYGPHSSGANPKPKPGAPPLFVKFIEAVLFAWAGTLMGATDTAVWGTLLMVIAWNVRSVK